jgi:hypothetical protein
MIARPSASGAAVAAVLLAVCAQTAVHAGQSSSAPAVRNGGALDKAPHPLLAPLVPQLRFGFYKQRPDAVQRSTETPPSPDPKDFAGRYSPQEATLLLPGERGRMPSYTDRGARTFLGRAQDDIAGRPRADPPTHCKPEGAVRALNKGFTVQVLQSPTQITMIHMENHLVRYIRLGGVRNTAAKPSFVGTSTGHWQGNTLVVETRAIRGGSWLDEYGNPGSERMMLTERYTKQPSGALRLEATINDPVNYSEPIRIVRNWNWTPNVAWDEMICEDNNHDAPVQQP